MNTPSPIHSLALNPAATARAANISKGHLYSLWRKGEGPPFIRVGADRRVLIKDLQDWLESLREVT